MHAHIATLPGDGVGPEVIDEALRVLAAVGDRFGHRFDIEYGLIGGAAIETTGHSLPVATANLTHRAHAVLLGAVGGPKWDDPSLAERPERGLLALRRIMGTYANIRPVRVSGVARDFSPLRPERLAGVDLVVVRELTGGLYFGKKRRFTGKDGDEVASDDCTYTAAEVERVVRTAGELARTRRHKVTSVDKANVLETSRLWRSVAEGVMRDEFPDVTYDVMLVDACAMHLMMNPARFDVIVTENLFGDILTDEAAVIAGSIGLLPSASLGHPRTGGRRRVGLYEPIHGSAPDIAGQGKANPVGTVLSVAMMLRTSLELHDEALAVEQAVDSALEDGWRTPDITLPGLRAHSTAEVGAEIAQRVQRMR
ncbi:MAG: 3-isopropylmalate dehydrogenase [Gemmatimonadetes bacterium]|nr:3-isopropylmalate dehydrogenase [Gemmatimonadota bacterium]